MRTDMYRNLPSDPADRVSANLGVALTPFHYVPKAIGDQLEFAHYSFGSTSTDGVDVVPIKGAWVHRTWNVNDAVVHVGVPERAESISDLALRVERALATPIGFVYWLKPVNLHIVCSGTNLFPRFGGIDLDNADMRRGRYGISKDTSTADPRSNLVGVSIVDLTAKRVAHVPHPRLTRLRSVAAAIEGCLTALVA